MEGFPLLHAIFYSEFHPTQGPKVVYEVPEGFVQSSISSSGGSLSMLLSSLAWQDSAHIQTPPSLNPPHQRLGASSLTPSHGLGGGGLPMAITSSASSTATSSTVTAATAMSQLRAAAPKASSTAAAAPFLSTDRSLTDASTASSISTTRSSPTISTPTIPSSTLPVVAMPSSSSLADPSQPPRLQKGASLPPSTPGPFDLFPLSPNPIHSGHIYSTVSMTTTPSRSGGAMPTSGRPPIPVGRQLSLAASDSNISLSSPKHNSSYLPSRAHHQHTKSTGSDSTSNSNYMIDGQSFAEGLNNVGGYSLFSAAAATTSNPHLLLDFDAISDYIIPKSDLCNKIVTLSATPPYKIVGHPVLIEHPKYERNAMLFNLCFVFDSTANTACYEQIVTKMARVLRSLEVESEFLSNPATKASVLNIIEQLLEDLNSYNECQIPINDANTINLKLFPHYPQPPPVFDYQVPVSMLDLESIMDKHWDLTMRRVIPFVNGIHSVRRISDLADVNIMLVRLAVQHLLYYGCVRLIDIFQFSNIYSVTAIIATLVTSEEAQNDCIQFVRKPNAPLPAFGGIFSLYCSLKGGLTLSDWIHDNPKVISCIDVRRFIVYGLLKGFVYRVHKYPILTRAIDDARLANDPVISRCVRDLYKLIHTLVAKGSGRNASSV
ncbi:hypothetical protein BSLG_001194 [Batrachochytrium salamandrivorans]|nr:hypothetical protein BSLG_001194 [Batrachochytrium salamandrivorans]